jgi:hypothetical protein
MRSSTSRLLPLVVLLGCAGHSQHQQKTEGPRLPEERVAGRAEWIDVNLAPLAYRRLGTDPQVGPWKILFSQQRHYCPVADSTYVMVQTGTLFPCAWRVVRQ